MNKKLRTAIFILLLCVGPGCAGFGRQWSAGCAENFGADWIIIKSRMDGTTYRCWKLHNTSVTNEGNSDGIYWKDEGGHLVHVSGWYDRVQVFHDDYDGAAQLLGVDAAKCGHGAYPAVNGSVEPKK
jgi:hypothetical protein